MAQELSSIDLFFLMKEIKVLEESRVENIFQKEEHIIFQFYIPGKEKKFLHVFFPNYMFLSDTKEEIEESGKLALSLRKHLLKTRIKKILQKEFERIIEIEIETLTSNYFLLIELFRPGNLILCDKNYKIIMAKEYKGFGSRLIRPGAIYDYPKKEVNFLNLDEGKFVKSIETTDKDSIVITLAVNFGLGGKYAEEICHRAKIDKKKIQLEKKEISQIYNVFDEIKKMSPEPFVYFENNKPVNFSPFDLITFKNNKKEKFNLFSEAISKYFLSISEEQNIFVSKKDNEKIKLQGIIKKQEVQIKGFFDAFQENQKKGEAIYEKYAFLDKVLSEIKKAREKHSIREIKEKLENHKIIKEVNEKEKKITIDLD